MRSSCRAGKLNNHMASAPRTIRVQPQPQTRAISSAGDGGRGGNAGVVRAVKPLVPLALSVPSKRLVSSETLTRSKASGHGAPQSSSSMAAKLASGAACRWSDVLHPSLCWPCSTTPCQVPGQEAAELCEPKSCCLAAPFSGCCGAALSDER